jgi:hypothetical protein
MLRMVLFGAASLALVACAPDWESRHVADAAETDDAGRPTTMADATQAGPGMPSDAGDATSLSADAGSAPDVAAPTCDAGAGACWGSPEARRSRALSRAALWMAASRAKP